MPLDSGGVPVHIGDEAHGHHREGQGDGPDHPVHQGRRHGHGFNSAVQRLVCNENMSNIGVEGDVVVFKTGSGRLNGKDPHSLFVCSW